MDSHVNGVEYKKLEDDWAAELDKSSTVDVKIQCRYSGDSSRPTDFIVKYKITDKDGFERNETKRIHNQEGGKQMSDIRENKQELNSIMQKIGNAILPVLDENWEKVVVGHFVEENGVTHLQFFVLNTDADDYYDLVKLSWDIDRYDDRIVDLEDLCKELRILCEEVNDFWTSFTYVLEGDGSYNADYEYDAIDNYDSRFIMDWQSKYLD